MGSPVRFGGGLHPKPAGQARYNTSPVARSRAGNRVCQRVCQTELCVLSRLIACRGHSKTCLAPVALAPLEFSHGRWMQRAPGCGSVDHVRAVLGMWAIAETVGSDSWPITGCSGRYQADKWSRDVSTMTSLRSS